MIRPACGHSSCRQNWIDTGDPRCTREHPTFQGEPLYRLDSLIVGTAIAIRDALPHVTLSEALTYADASTVQGRSFRSRSGFCGLGTDRVSFAIALEWYARQWSESEDDRLMRIRRRERVTLSAFARFEREDPEVRRVYGEIIRSRPVPALIVAWERFVKRARRKGIAIPYWPGLAGMAPHDASGKPLPIPCYSWEASEEATIRAWWRGLGFSPEAIEAYAPRTRGEAFETMRAHLRDVDAAASKRFDANRSSSPEVQS